MKEKYKELMDKITQDPDSLKELHVSVENPFSDLYVQIEKSTNEFRTTTDYKEERKNMHHIAKVAAGFILVILAVIFINFCGTETHYL